MSRRRVRFSLPDAGLIPSPLQPVDREPVIIDSEMYKIQNFFSKNQNLLCPLDKIQPSMPEKNGMTATSLMYIKSSSLSRSLPLLSVQKLNFTSGIIKCEENMLNDIYMSCVYDPDRHLSQIKFIEKFPSANKKETIIISTMRKLLELIPEEETELLTELENIIAENDSLKLVPLQEKLLDIYNKYFEDISRGDELFRTLTKILVFTSRFSVKNFYTRDASLVANYAGENSFPQYQSFFVELGELLNCDFIDRDLRASLIDFLKYFNDRVVISLRWVLLNINEQQIVTKESIIPKMTFSLSKPVEGAELANVSIFDPKKTLSYIAERSSHVSMILRKQEGNDVVKSWRAYFDTTEACYKGIENDYSPEKLIQNGSLFGKSIAALTKFGPVSGKINADLPEIVSEIVSNISIIDETIAHTRSGYILIDNVISSLIDSLRKLREKAMAVRDPTDAASYGILYFNIIKLCSIAHNRNIEQTILNKLAPHVDVVAQFSHKDVQSMMSHIAFQLSNINMKLNAIQIAFIHAELALNALSQAFTRSSKKIRDSQQKQYASQWASYINSLAGCLRAIANDKTPKRQLSDIMSVLNPIATRAASMYVVNEVTDVLNTMKTLYDLVNNDEIKVDDRDSKL
jgi:hypothetical protein